MKLGTHIRLSDGREATVVFHGLTGYGIVFGKITIPDGMMDGTSGDLFDSKKDIPSEYEPVAMLRKKELEDLLDMECVGEKFEIL